MEIDVKQLISAIRIIAEEKNLSEDAVHDAVEQAVVAAWKKDNDLNEVEAKAELNTNTGDIKIIVKKNITEDVVDEELDISLSDAKKIDPKAKIDTELEQIFEPKKFGRVAAQVAKQVILQSLREQEREIILDEYSDKIGTVVNGVVARIEPRLIRVDLGKAQGIMPGSEQIPGEHYSIGQRIKSYLRDVERTGRGPQLILSRANEEFIYYLFKAEVPEMENNAVEIKKIVREAGGRTKLAVSASVPGVDPVGTFVGGHGTRVQAVSGEINDTEKIDIIPYSEDIKEYIGNALAPTEITKIEINEEDKKATIFVENSQLSIAIGRGGQNVRLASKLTGYELDIEEVTAGKAADAPEDKSEAATTKEESAKPSSEPASSVKPTEHNRIKSKTQVEEDLLATIEATSDDSETKDQPKSDQPDKD